MHAPATAPQVAGESAGGQDGGTVRVAYCHDTTVSHSFHVSLMDMLVYDKTVGLNAIQGAPIRAACSGPFGVIEGRNTVVSTFLEGDEDWLFWVDTDMGFKPDSLDRLLAAADPVDRPIVGGLCFAAQRVDGDGYGGFKIVPRPTLFGITPLGFVSVSKYKPDALQRVAGTGSAFILIHRTVLEAIRAMHGPVWYDPVTPQGGRPISEDLSFCWRATDRLFPIYVHTGIKTTHHKEIWVEEGMYDMPKVDPIFKRQ